MKRISFLFLIISLALTLFLCSCGENQSNTDNTDTSGNQQQIFEYDVTDVRDFKCEITFGQTNEEYVLEDESAKELYNIIQSYEKTKTNRLPSSYPSMNYTTDYIYIVFSGEPTVIYNMEYYGCYHIYTNDIVSGNLSPYWSSVFHYQFESGIYNEVESYIKNHVENSEA